VYSPLKENKNFKESFMEQVAIYIGIGIAGGVLSGLFGVGGGIVIVPLLTLVVGMGQHKAQGMSLGIIVFCIFTMLNYFKKGYVDYADLKIIAIIGIGFIIGGFLGSTAASALPGVVLKKCFAVFMIIVACKMLFFK
jgi:uncharacterized membrane protein YfcA